MTQTMREQLHALVDELRLRLLDAELADRRCVFEIPDLLRLRAILATPEPAVAELLGETPQSFAEKWYRPDSIKRCIAQSRTCASGSKVPENVYSEEFAEWMTHEYRLAMAKWIQIGISSKPEPAVTVRKGWVCKDRQYLWWSEREPELFTDGKWDIQCASIILPKWAFTDPWPDKPNGGPECVMEVG